MLFLLCSCNASTSFDGSESTLSPSLDDAPDYSLPYNFDSYSELENAFKNKSSYEQLHAEKSNFGTTYQQMIDDLSDNTTHIYIPKFNGTDATLRNQEGFSNISLFTKELYNLPWIWYYCLYNNTDVTVKLTYLSSIEVDASSTDSCAETLRKISSGAVNIDNFHTFENYKNVTEIELTLADKTVSALKYELKDSEKITVSFVYNDVYVMIKANASLLTDTFWSDFSLR